MLTDVYAIFSRNLNSLPYKSKFEKRSYPIFEEMMVEEFINIWHKIQYPVEATN